MFKLLSVLTGVWQGVVIITAQVSSLPLVISGEQRSSIQCGWLIDLSSGYWDIIIDKRRGYYDIAFNIWASQGGARLPFLFTLGCVCRVAKFLLVLNLLFQKQAPERTEQLTENRSWECSWRRSLSDRVADVEQTEEKPGDEGDDGEGVEQSAG